MSTEVLAASLFSWVDDAGNTNTLDVDVVMASVDRRTAKLTDHVVEDGSVITDHVVIAPEELSLDLVVSQTPIKAPGFTQEFIKSDRAPGHKLTTKIDHPMSVRQSEFQPGGFLLLSSGLRSIVSGLISGVENNATFTGSVVEEVPATIQVQTLQNTGTDTDRVVAVHDMLIEILDNVLLVTVSFKGHLYINYLLTEVELTQSAGKFGVGHFKVQARAFRTVTGVTVVLPDPADFRALPNTNKGNKPTTTPDPDPHKKGETWAHRGLDQIKKLVGIP